MMEVRFGLMLTSRCAPTGQAGSCGTGSFARSGGERLARKSTKLRKSLLTEAFEEPLMGIEMGRGGDEFIAMIEGEEVQYEEVGSPGWKKW